MREIIDVATQIIKYIQPKCLNDESSNKKRYTQPSVYVKDVRKQCKVYSEAFPKRDQAAKKIQTSWRHAISCPSYEICQRRLMREFQEISTSA